MVIKLPRLRCPNCGKSMGPVTANSIPRANTYEECLRKCTRCLIGATNAISFAKVKFIQAPPPVLPPVQEPGQPPPPEK